ncbi:MAG: DUF3575 domain-containing protein [Bacteroidales bacterium]|nr:DUF3575 domain-containing protein [Bacteroidales bacterium]
MRNKIILALAVVFAALVKCTDMSAQKASLSTNIVGYANFLTMNLEASCPVARHWNLYAGTKYNPFTFNLGKGKESARNRQQAYYAGVRYWPWNVYSGWWVAGKLQYQEYSSGGIFSRRTREGDRAGLALGGGYAYMIGKHFNIEFGAMLWSGVDFFTSYSCPVCGSIESSGRKVFVLPSDIIVALSYIF